MANYADYLSHFNFDVVYKPTKLNTNADYCSRIPSTSTESDVNNLYGEGDEIEQFALLQMQQLPVRAEHIARETRKDPQLGSIIRELELGHNLAQTGYKAPEAKYTFAANCLLFEHRVVIPSALRQAILNDLHTAHFGVVKMKGLARSYVYWPGIDSDIERTAKSCTECARHGPTPPKYSSHHWEYPSAPWQRIHVDYAGPVAGSMLLIVVDAFSKWFEVKITKSTTAAATIQLLDELFSAYGAPVTLVSDNGPQFASSEFRDFLLQSGVKYHKLSAPYHPATNGQAERYVQTVKNGLKAMGTTNGNLQTNLNTFLQFYRKAPHTETGESPAKLFLGRNIRTRLDLVRPQKTNETITEKQKSAFEPSFRSFTPGQQVYVLSGNARMDKWIPGTVQARLGDLHYEIVYEGKHLKRHVDQMRSFDNNELTRIPSNEARFSTLASGETTRRSHFYGNPVTSQELPSDTELRASSESASVSSESSDEHFSTPNSSPTRNRQSEGTPPVVRRSTRLRRRPVRYSP